MPEEDKQTLCCQVIALLHRMWDKLPMDTQHTVKSCICEGKITEAKSVLQKIHDVCTFFFSDNHTKEIVIVHYHHHDN